MTVKKKTFDFRNPMVWGSIVVSVGIVFAFLTKVVDFFRLPEALASTNDRVTVVENEEKQLSEIIKEQQVINNYIHKQEIKSKEPMVSPDGKYILDEESGKWRKR